jgi:hypothetical protein
MKLGIIVLALLLLAASAFADDEGMRIYQHNEKVIADYYSNFYGSSSFQEKALRKLRGQTITDELFDAVVNAGPNILDVSTLKFSTDTDAAHLCQERLESRSSIHRTDTHLGAYISLVTANGIPAINIYNESGNVFVSKVIKLDPNTRQISESNKIQFVQSGKSLFIRFENGDYWISLQCPRFF